MSEAAPAPSRRVIVVFESMFGNTEAVARTVAAGVEAYVPVDVVTAASAPERIDGYALLVAGGPTHAFGLTRPSTRRSAVDQGAPGPAAAGLREWLAALGRPRTAVPAATFDTRIRKRWLPGSAAWGVRRRLGKLGFDTSRGAVSFWVTGTPGPLADGELERAHQWGATLGRQVRARDARPVASAG